MKYGGSEKLKNGNQEFDLRLFSFRFWQQSVFFITSCFLCYYNSANLETLIKLSCLQPDMTYTGLIHTFLFFYPFLSGMFIILFLFPWFLSLPPSCLPSSSSDETFFPSFNGFSHYCIGCLTEFAVQGSIKNSQSPFRWEKGWTNCSIFNCDQETHY